MFSTGTLGEKKANVKPDFSFALLSPQPSSGAKTRGDIPKKELLARSTYPRAARWLTILAISASGRRFTQKSPRESPRLFK
jgi:hypothetical protein